MDRIPDLARCEPLYDLIIIGAGPAGLAAAIDAGRYGMRTLIVDENATAGGQIYRSLLTTPLREQHLPGTDHRQGQVLLDAFEQAAGCYAASTTVWSLRPQPDGGGCEVGLSLGGQARYVDARHVIVATGALERPLPIPGWTLPGVVTAGGAQILLKSAGVVPDGQVVLAGCGPLLWLLAVQLRAVGVALSAIVDTTARGQWTRAGRELPNLIRSSYFIEGLKLLRAARSGQRVISDATGLRAEGDGRVQTIVIERGRRDELRLEADALVLHQGIVPNVNLAMAAGCHHDWDATLPGFVPRLDRWLGSSVPGVCIAGDGAGIAGAQSARLRGQLAAVATARRLKTITADDSEKLARPLRAALAHEARGRRFLNLFYQPAVSFRVPTQMNTIVCRCEDVAGRHIRDAIALGVPGPNQLKAFSRCGMGACQGRECGLTVTEMIAEARGVTPDEVGYYRLRSPVKPITVSELASLPRTQQSDRAVAQT